MKRFIFTGFAALIAMLMLSACGGAGASENSEIQVNTTEINNSKKMLSFQVGKITESQKVEYTKLQKSSFTGSELLQKSQSVCLKVYYGNDKNPTLGECQPVIEGSYPVISVPFPDVNKIRVKMFAYKYQNTDFTNDWGIIGETNQAIFSDIDVLFSDLFGDPVKLGSLYAVDFLDQYFTFKDTSKSPINFSNVKIVSLKSEEYLQKRDNSDSEKKYLWTSFGLEKDIDYSKFCFDAVCYEIPNGFDLLNDQTIDLANWEKN